MPKLVFPVDSSVDDKAEVLQKAISEISDVLIMKIKDSIPRDLKWDTERGRISGDVTVELEQSELEKIEDDPHSEESFLVNLVSNTEMDFNHSVNKVIAKVKLQIANLETD